MTSLFSIWMLPVSPQKCAAHQYNVTCDFSLYSNASSLQQHQKLAPAIEFTGDAIVQAFMFSSIMAILLSLSLLVDRYKWHVREDDHSEDGSDHRHFYLRLIYVVEKLLHTLSDQQLVAGFALLALLNRKACEISAYHFNLACSLLFLSAVTHLSPLVSIHDYASKGRSIATFRVAAIAIQYGMTVTALAARNSESFPAKASSLAIMPAACFENMAAGNNFGLDDFLTTAGNLSDIASNVTSAVSSNSTLDSNTTWHDIQAVVAPSQGKWEYLTLVVLLALAALFLLTECIHTKLNPGIVKHKPFGWAGAILSGVSIVASSAVVGSVLYNHYNLRKEMEVDSWVQLKEFKLQAPGYSSFLTVLLASSASLAMVQAIFESLAGHKGRRFAQAMRRHVQNIQQSLDVVDQSSKEEA